MLLNFADDTKGVSSVDSAKDAEILQQHLDNLFKWSSDWQMLLTLINAMFFISVQQIWDTPTQSMVTLSLK